MELLFQQIFNGLTIGSVYTLVALGLTLVFGILHVPNFAHGAFYMVGAYITLMMMVGFGFNYWVAIIASVAVVALLGVVTQQLIFKKLEGADGMRMMVAAIGILLFLEAFGQFMWGTEYYRMDTPYSSVVNLFGLTVTLQRLLIIIAAIILMLALHFFLTKTMIGAAIIAMAQNREGAFLVGINANQVAWLTFAIAGGLAAAAASLASPINLVFPTMGNLVIMKAFVIIIIGGMGSIPGAIIGGYLLGLTESIGATYISSDYKDVIAFLLLVVILTAKPTGLFTKGVQ
ncbi:branched-chain amino acid ABC transporter permease [Guptibacillus hwajinpoensis]|uniref:ABC transporter permease n=1 Tax=Guptibacillus hwajinpoensis TaxID=208199 RepID=A0A0J6CYS9_9BACL|nr:branched-chain amino acid ABC transporter permease [Alkalihalobacillus macyae]KMM38258.1 ABC transporter permease [Alkalihalobacillus macyae]MDP4549891.1 branched-chain amino acid ABC transporter permease [Alkalihalobacillus macyae]